MKIIREVFLPLEKGSMKGGFFDASFLLGKFEVSDFTY